MPQIYIYFNVQKDFANGFVDDFQLSTNDYNKI